MNFTYEQTMAINKRNCNLLVSAGAGSGKTAVLVERIINKVLKENIDITKILVVTFTNAAASEMKERVLNKLYDILDNEPDNILLQSQISNLNKANIMTIHSFCLDVIRNYYYQIDIDPNFKIANDIDNELMKYEIIEEMFEKQYENLDEEFLNLTQMYDSKNDQDNLRDVILDIYRYVINTPFPQKSINELIDELKQDNSIDFEQTVWGKYAISKIIDNINIAINEYDKILDLVEGLDKQTDFFLERKQEMINLLNIQNLKWDEIVNLLNNISFPRRQSKEIEKETSQIIGIYWDNIKNIFKQIDFKINTDTIMKQQQINKKENIYLLNMVNEFYTLFSNKKKESNILDFNDLEHYCLQILLNDEKPSDVALEYRNKFEEILIDEYQDSNYIQEYILNIISKVDEGIPNIFMVGDVKQSIYKFRGAKPEIFLGKYYTYNECEDINQDEQYLKINLYKNFRSRNQILDFTNYIFSNIMSKQIGEIEYNKNEFLNCGAQYEILDNVNNKVEIDIIDVNNENEINNEYELDNENQLDNIQDEDIISEDIEYEAKFIVNKINEMINNKFQVLDKKTGKYRDVRYSDIVILLRSTKGISQVYNEIFKQNGISLFVDNSTGYLDEIEVQTVINMLKIIDNPYQDIPLVSVLKSPFGNFTDDELIEIRNIDKTSYFYICMQKMHINQDSDLCKKVSNFISKINDYQDKSKYLKVSKLIWNIYEDTSYLLYMKKEKNYENKKANLMLLFERAKQFEQSSFKGLFNFINFIEKIEHNKQDLGTATIIGENDNVVRLFSIHKSKGLEFPVVFLSNINKKFNYKDLYKNILLHQDFGLCSQIIDLDKRIKYPSIYKKILQDKLKYETISEEMRILYVALTRAKEKLILTGISKNTDNDLEKIKYLFIKDLNSYMKMICYILANKGYDKNIVDFNIVNSNEIVIENNEVVDVIQSNDKLDNEFDKNKYTDICDCFNKKYVYDYLTKIPHKISVSELKRKFNDQEDNIVNIYQDEIIPTFMKQQEGSNDESEIVNKNKKNNNLSPLEIGNLYHYIFQKLDFTKEYSVKDIQNEINKIAIDFNISNDNIKVIDINKIHRFVTSNLYERARNSNKIYKEEAFLLQVQIKELLEYFKIEDIDINNISQDETVLLQGIIDMFFYEDNEIVLVDYKTDKVNNTQIIKNRYEKQLEYYEKALTSITNKKVKGKYIFLVETGQVVEM